MAETGEGDDEDDLVDPPWGEPEPLPPPWETPTSTVRPGGMAAWDLEEATAEPSALSDRDLIEAIRGFDHAAAWAQARQAVMLAEFARRRPPIPADRNDPDTSGISRYAGDEVGLALTLSRGAAGDRIAQAVRLREVLPDTLALWQAGRLDLAKVRLLCDMTLLLDDAHARAVQDRVLPRAPRQTWAQLRAAIAKAIIAVDPEGANERHRRARKQRRVGVSPEADGMASLWAFLSAPDALTAYGWLTALARGLGPEDPRSMDTRRADLLVALLTGNLILAAPADVDDAEGDDGHDGRSPIPVPAPMGTAPIATAPEPATSGPATPSRTAPEGVAARPDGAGPAPAGPGGTTAGDRTAPTGDGEWLESEAVRSEPWTGSTGNPAAGVPRSEAARPTPPSRPAPVAPSKPLVHIVIPHSTLLGHDDQPVELAGYGPIPADLAREIATDAVWRRLVTDPLSGALLDVGRQTYRPPAGLANHVQARDVLCRMPVCRRRVAECDLDHTVGWAAGGTTCEANLHGECRCHHRLKDQPGWQVEQHADGRITWTTPTGHRYRSDPFDYRAEPDLQEVAAAFARAARDEQVRQAAAVAQRRRPAATPIDWTVTGRPPGADEDPPPF